MSATPSPRFLVAVDADYRADLVVEKWLVSLCAGLVQDGATVDFLERYPESDRVHAALEDSGATVLAHTDTELPDVQSYADNTIRLALKSRYDRVLVQGFDLSVAVSETELLSTSLWAWLDDAPASPRFLENDRHPALETLARGSNLILTGSEEVRSQCESQNGAVTSKMRVVTVNPRAELTVDQLPSGDPILFIDWPSLHKTLRDVSFHRISAEALRMRSPLRLVVTGVGPEDKESTRSVLEECGLVHYPGLILDESGLTETRWLTNQSMLLSDRSGTSANVGSVVTLSHRLQLGIVDISDIGDSYAALVTAFGNATPATGIPEAETGSVLRQLSRDLPDFDAHPLRPSPTRVLLAGADFKFAGDIVDALVQRPDVEVKVDLFKANAHPQPAVSSQLLPWADVIIAEFAAKNAIWYSQNVLPHQTLIVHLHGYELLEDWIEELNIDAVTTIVVASEFYRQKAINLRRWPAHKFTVIPNSVQPSDLARPKLPDARFHLGLVGIVPVLKRPDRALDLLEKLIETDERYVLHIKGHNPWNYPWEWTKSAHQDSYRTFYRRIGESPALASHIAFEPFSPDMGNWLRKIGWILSPSTRETFHLAAVEGATSGAVPVAWRREGSDEIIGEEFNVDSTNEAVERILRANHDAASYAELSIRAQDRTEKYSSSLVKNQWLSLVFNLKDSASGRKQQAAADSGLSSFDRQLIDEVTRELRHGDTDGALAVLDENIQRTAGASGPVKDLELFVRGVAAADERRFIHYLPSEQDEELLPWRPLTVRASGTALLQLMHARFDSDVVDVAPPAALRAGYTPARDFSDIQPDHASVVIDPEGPLRFDRWAEAVKLKIEEIARDGGFAQLVAAGPWWLAFPVSKAADALGLSFHWVITEEASLSLLSGDLDNRLSNNATAQVARSAFHRADQRLVASPELLTASTPYLAMDAVLPGGDATDAPFGLALADAREFAKRRVEPMSTRTTEPPSALLRPLSSLRIATIASRDVNRRLRELAAEVVEIPVRDYFDSLDAGLDVLIIDASADDAGPWKGRVAHSRAEGPTPTTKILDRARLLGIPTVFVYEPESLVPRKFAATARKADQVCVSWPRAVDTLFALNPSSNTTASLWRSSESFADNLSLSLRNLGVAVPAPELTSVPKDVPAADEQPDSDFSPAELAESHGLERVSLILATYGGASRISRMLDSIAQQSLPHNLIELIVVENGKHDGTEALVNTFAETHPDMSVVYLFDAQASAGNARNVGLERASGEFITFVDDDDYLQENYLLSMWLTAGDDTVVIGGLADETPDGELNTQTPNNNRIQSLNGGRLPLRNRAGLLGMNACKLIPAHYLADHRFAADLHSGEDTVFMAGLLRHPELEIVPAAPMDDAMYVRLLRDSSLSRREATFGFAVEERVPVINHLHRLEEAVPAGAKNAVAYLADSQGSFIRNFLADHPDQREVAESYIAQHAHFPEKIRLT